MQGRKRENSLDIKAYLNSLGRNPKYTEEMLQLIEEDLQSGLTIGETELYAKKKLSFAQMKVYSACLRNGYPEAVTSCLTREGLAGEQMATALEFYEKGVPLEIVAEVTGDVSRTAHTMKKMFQSTMRQMAERKETEKDQLLEQQQNELNEARITILELKKERDALLKREKEKDSRREEEAAGGEDSCKEDEAAVREDSRRESEAAAAEKEELPWDAPARPDIPVSGALAVLDGEGKVLSLVPVERVEKEERRQGVSALKKLFEKLGDRRKKPDFMKLLAGKGLLAEQLAQVRKGIEAGLTERQLHILVDHPMPAGQMEELIRIAVYENGRKEG